jgi:hypothetical protein
VDALKRHPLAILVLMRRMFTCQQIPKMMELKALLEAAVREHPELPAQERGNLLGECDLILSFLMYNDITRMSRLHRSASRQMTRPAVTLRNSGSWTFGSPSVLMMYYRAPGELGKELAEMYECMPHYYKITQGHGQGAELVMDAEAAFMQGHFERAVLLLERARVRAASCGQENMALCCDFLALRLSLCGQAGEPFDFEARRAALLQRHDAVLLHLLESIEEELFGQFERSMQSYIHSFDIAGLVGGLYRIVQENEAVCRVLLFGRRSTELIHRMIAYAHDLSISAWRKTLKNASADELEMLYLCLSNGLLSVVLDGYDRFDQQSVIRFVEQMYRQAIAPFM